MIRRPPRSTLFPYTTLFRSEPGSLPLPHTTVVLGRGPYSAADDEALLRTHGIEWLVAKNAGGEATRGKLDAARALGLPVVMVQRPALPQRQRTGSVAAVLHWIRSEERRVGKECRSRWSPYH